MPVCIIPSCAAPLIDLTIASFILGSGRTTVSTGGGAFGAKPSSAALIASKIVGNTQAMSATERRFEKLHAHANRK
jgi:uncharacterized membrane protein YjjB (DUF3815 family)